MNTERPTFGEYEQELLAGTARSFGDFNFSHAPSIDSDRMQALMSGEFVDTGENVLLIGDGGCGKTHLSHAIACGAARRSKTVRYILGDGYGRYPNYSQLAESATSPDGPIPSIEYAGCDLLVINELPDPGHDWYEHARDRTIFGALLAERCRRGLSTVINTRKHPEDWIKYELLGYGTFRVLGQTHVGIFLDRQDPRHEPFFDRVSVPQSGDDRALFEAFGRFPTSSVRDPHMMKEYFQATPPRLWHWFDIKEPSYRLRLREQV